MGFLIHNGQIIISGFEKQHLNSFRCSLVLNLLFLFFQGPVNPHKLYCNLAFLSSSSSSVTVISVTPMKHYQKTPASLGLIYGVINVRLSVDMSA